MSQRDGIPILILVWANRIFWCSSLIVCNGQEEANGILQPLEQGQHCPRSWLSLSRTQEEFPVTWTRTFPSSSAFPFVEQFLLFCFNTDGACFFCSLFFWFSFRTSAKKLRGRGDNKCQIISCWLLIPGCITQSFQEYQWTFCLDSVLTRSRCISSDDFLKQDFVFSSW